MFQREAVTSKKLFAVAKLNEEEGSDANDSDDYDTSVEKPILSKRHRILSKDDIEAKFIDPVQIQQTSANLITEPVALPLLSEMANISTKNGPELIWVDVAEKAATRLPNRPRLQLTRALK